MRAEQKGEDLDADDQKKKKELKELAKKHFDTEDLGEVDVAQLKEAMTPSSVVGRMKYRRKIGNALTGKKDLVVVKGLKYTAEEKMAKDMETKDLNPDVGFPCLHYSVSEGAGVLKVEIIKKNTKSMKLGIRTLDDTATGEEDYEKIDKEIVFAAGDKKKSIEIKIIDDNEWEPDEDFLIELYDLESGEKMVGVDTVTRVTIIDDDEPGIISFKQRTVKVNHKNGMGSENSKQKKAIIKLVRQHGCDGTVSVNYELEDSVNPNQESAKKFEHYVPHSSRIEFLHGETEKEIEVEILSENLNDESDVYFNVKLSDPQPEGCKLSKKDTCQVNIIGEDETENAVKDIEKIILLMQKQDKVSYLG